MPLEVDRPEFMFLLLSVFFSIAHWTVTLSFTLWFSIVLSVYFTPSFVRFLRIVALCCVRAFVSLTLPLPPLANYSPPAPTTFLHFCTVPAFSSVLHFGWLSMCILHSHLQRCCIVAFLRQSICVTDASVVVAGKLLLCKASLQLHEQSAVYPILNLRPYIHCPLFCALLR